MERPKKTDDYVVKAAAELVAADLQRWCNARDSGERSIIEFKPEAIRVVKHCGIENGYELAKLLERDHNYQPDTELVESLDMVWHHLNDAHNRATREWVKGWPSTCPVAIGDKVSFTSGLKTYAGEVTAIDNEVAKCTVRCASENHTEGAGFVVEWERLTKDEAAI